MNRFYFQAVILFFYIAFFRVCFRGKTKRTAQQCGSYRLAETARFELAGAKP